MSAHDLLALTQGGWDRHMALLLTAANGWSRARMIALSRLSMIRIGVK